MWRVKWCSACFFSILTVPFVVRHLFWSHIHQAGPGTRPLPGDLHPPGYHCYLHDHWWVHCMFSSVMLASAHITHTPPAMSNLSVSPVSAKVRIFLYSYPENQAQPRSTTRAKETESSTLGMNTWVKDNDVVGEARNQTLIWLTYMFSTQTGIWNPVYNTHGESGWNSISDMSLVNPRQGPKECRTPEHCSGLWMAESEMKDWNSGLIVQRQYEATVQTGFPEPDTLV